VKDGRADLLFFLDFGVDEGGASLGVSLVRLKSHGTYYDSRVTWRTDPTLDWATLDPH
jgi:hypothetical protein